MCRTLYLQSITFIIKLVAINCEYGIKHQIVNQSINQSINQASKQSIQIRNRQENRQKDEHTRIIAHINLLMRRA